MFSDLPAEPGVYRSVHQLAQRWVFYALGLECETLGCRRPECHETDDEVVAMLRELVPDEPRVPTLALVNEDSIIAAGLDPVFHRPLSLPRGGGLALVRELSPPSPG